MKKLIALLCAVIALSAVFSGCAACGMVEDAADQVSTMASDVEDAMDDNNTGDTASGKSRSNNGRVTDENGIISDDDNIVGNDTSDNRV